MGLLDRLRNAFVRQPQQVASSLVTRAARRFSAGTQVMQDLPLWQQFMRVGGQITPMTVTAAIRDADGGRMYALVDLGNEMRQKDCHLQSTLGTSEEAIAGLPWELVAPNEPSRREEKAGKSIESMLRQTPDLTRMIAHQAGAAFYGYAVSETMFRKDGTFLVPETFVCHSARRFVFAYATGALQWWDTAGTVPYPGVDFRAEFPDKFIVSQPRINGDVPCREGLIRVLMWAALFRNWSLADWLKLGEIAWKPWRTATYPKAEESTYDIDGLVAILEGMTSSGVAVTPDTSNLKIEWPKSGGTGTSSHHELFSAVAAEMSKCILGQTLTTEQTRVGSQALGNVHNEVRKDLRESRSKFVANDVSRDLIVPLTRMNYGPDVRPYRLRFLTDDALDLANFSTGVKNLKDAGTRIPAVWVRGQAGIPEPEEGEEILGESDGDEEETEDPEGGPGGGPKDPAADEKPPAPAEAA